MFPSSKKLWSTFQVYIDTQLASIVVWQQASEGWLYYREGDPDWYVKSIRDWKAWCYHKRQKWLNTKYNIHTTPPSTIVLPLELGLRTTPFFPCCSILKLSLHLTHILITRMIMDSLSLDPCTFHLPQTYLVVM